jgi:hypothetical protein
MRAILRFGLLILLYSTPIHSENPVKKSSAPKEPPAQEQRGTKDSPLFIKQIPNPKTEEESAQDAKEREEKMTNDRKLVQFTGILALVGFLQLVVFGLQSYYLRRTVRAAIDQSDAMERAIQQASRSAKAMEEVAEHIETSIGTAIEQSKSLERSVGEAGRSATAMETVAKEIAVSSQAAVASVSAINQERPTKKFQAIPSIVNAGLTPAHKVSFQADAAILPVPLPDDFTFPLPDTPNGTSVIGPRQNITVSPIVKDFVDDAEVEGNKSGNQGKGLYTWGIFTYQDIFGKPQYTRWCHLYTWPDGKTTWGYYANRHNDAS